MAKNVSVKLELDSLSKILARRGLQDNGPAQKEAASELKRLCEPYVPMNTGILKSTAQVQQDGVLYGARPKNKSGTEYGQSYAAKQYYSNAGTGKDGTSQGGTRGKQWDKRMMADRGEEYINAVAKIVGGKAK